MRVAILGLNQSYVSANPGRKKKITIQPSRELVDPESRVQVYNPTVNVQHSLAVWFRRVNCLLARPARQLRFGLN